MIFSVMATLWYDRKCLFSCIYNPSDHNFTYMIVLSELQRKLCQRSPQPLDLSFKPESETDHVATALRSLFYSGMMQGKRVCCSTRSWGRDVKRARAGLVTALLLVPCCTWACFQGVYLQQTEPKFVFIKWACWGKQATSQLLDSSHT